MTERVYLYGWGNNEKRATLKGRRCVIVVMPERGAYRGGMNTVLIEFLDTGERVTTSRRALRDASDEQLAIA